MNTKDIFIDRFSNEKFRSAFKLYFAELDIKVSQWDALFDEMDHDPHGQNYAYLRLSEHGDVIGFIQFTALDVGSWFFEAKLGFIREFWIAEEYRNSGHGTALLRLTEIFFKENRFAASILTSDTAEHFYIKNGYTQMDGITAKNNAPVLIKMLAN